MNKKVMRHKAICDELNSLYERKNHDYGDSFHQTFVEEGLAMTRIRLGDKFSRFKTLSRLSANDCRSAAGYGRIPFGTPDGSGQLRHHDHSGDG